MECDLELNVGFAGVMGMRFVSRYMERVFDDIVHDVLFVSGLIVHQAII